jgi:hypothetical protein
MKLKNTYDQTHWRYHPTAQHGSDSSGPPECHVTQGSQTLCNRLVFITMRFSCLSATIERAQWLYVHIRQWSAEDAVMWLTNSPRNSLLMIWANSGTNDSAVQMPMLIFSLTAANIFTCEHLWTAFQLYTSCIWWTHTLAHVLSYVFPHARTHFHSCCMTSYTCTRHSTLSQTMFHVCAGEFQHTKPWQTQAELRVLLLLTKYLTSTFSSILMLNGKQCFTLTLIHNTHSLSWTAVCFNNRVRKISDEGNFAPRLLTSVIKAACQMWEKAT